MAVQYVAASQAAPVMAWAQPQHLLMMIYLMSRGGKEGSGMGVKSLKLRGSRGILWELGHRGTCSPAGCAVSGLGNQILKSISMPCCCYFQGDVFSSLFYNCLWKTERFSFFMKIIMTVSKKT